MNRSLINFLFMRSCGRKAALSKKRADEIATLSMRGKVLLYYYKCALCKSHHLTSKMPSEKDEKKLRDILQDMRKRDREYLKIKTREHWAINYTEKYAVVNDR